MKSLTISLARKALPNPLLELWDRCRNSSARAKSFTRFLSTSFASRGVSIVCQLIQVPVVLNGIGAEGFGYWMTLNSINYMMNFADLGLGMGLQNKLADAFAKEKNAEARVLFGSTFVVLLGIGCLLATLAGGVLLMLDLPSLFRLEDPAVSSNATAAAAISLSMFCLGLPLGLGQRLAYSRQLGWWHNTSQAAASIVTLLFLLAATYFQFGFLWFFIFGVLPTVAINGLLLLGLCHKLNWNDWLAFRPDFRAVKGVLSLGGHFSVQQVLNAVLYAVPPIVISSALGATAVTPFKLVQRMFNVFAVGQNAMMLALWPMYSEAHAKGEFDWIRKTLRKSLWGTLGIAILPMAIGAVFARPVIELWVGQETPMPSHALVWLLFLWNGCQFLQQVFWFLLAGVSEIKRLTWYSLAAAIACLLAMSGLVQIYGPEGVVAGLLLGYVPFLLGTSVLQSFSYLRAAERLPAAKSTSESTH